MAADYGKGFATDGQGRNVWVSTKRATVTWGDREWQGYRILSIEGWWVAWNPSLRVWMTFQAGGNIAHTSKNEHEAVLKAGTPVV